MAQPPPGNFWSIALTSTIGKIYHDILASHPESNLTQNSTIGTSTQKGFITGTNRVMEHMASMTAIIENARSMKCSLYIIFLDLANGFGSISHQLTHDMLTHIQLPPPVVQYLGDVFSKLQVFVSTPDWNTDAFASHLWVFQGDTISPITFLHCFDPLVKLANQHSSRGHVPHTPIPDSGSLPPVDSTIYLLWDVEPSPELVGWYKCRISSHSADDLSTVIYPNHCTETIDLCLQKWELARANTPRYLTPEKPAPYVALPWIREKVKEPKALLSSPIV